MPSRLFPPLLLLLTAGCSESTDSSHIGADATIAIVDPPTAIEVPASPATCLPDGVAIVDGSVDGSSFGPAGRVTSGLTLDGRFRFIKITRASNESEALGIFRCAGQTGEALVVPIASLSDEEELCEKKLAVAMFGIGERVSREATGGSVHFSSVSDACVAGEFSLDLAGEPLSGTFDAEVDLH